MKRSPGVIIHSPGVISHSLVVMNNSLANSHQPLEEQKEILIKQFNHWKGILDQVDDVIVIGIEV